MGDCDDDDLPVTGDIDDADWKASKEEPSKATSDGCSDSRGFANRFDCSLHIIEKCLPQSRHSRFVEGGGFIQFFPRRGKIAMADHFKRLRASAITSSPGIASTSPR